MRLGGLELATPFILSPMESVSDAAYRRLCWSLGAGLTWTEMIRARGLVRNNRSTLELVDSFDADVPTGLQLMVVNERELAEALEVIDRLAGSTQRHWRNLVAVDLNFGCPSPEVIKVGAGPALLKRRNKLRALFEVLRAWRARTALPIGAVTAKIRLGLNRIEMEQKVYLPIVELANELLDGLTVHARHAREESTTPAHWEAIAEVKRLARVPIIGNGDVTSLDSARRLMRETGCDGVMIARGAIRSPWLFRELTGRGPGTPTLAEVDAAEAAWRERATVLGSKPKFFEWHAEGFRRMRARLGGQPLPGDAMPRTEHMR
ncbi:MAG: tRNA-dihydrouridine synthase family protein [Myxococcaceae bacterium]|nr:tRNA-dihydrouridine synthase family protein [Myxococcaceae bacterium]MCA3012653.1 tRNA-dihydrouridine synthase family protein [Myxococcaceae bacterium]